MSLSDDWCLASLSADFNISDPHHIAFEGSVAENAHSNPTGELPSHDFYLSDFLGGITVTNNTPYYCFGHGNDYYTLKCTAADLTENLNQDYNFYNSHLTSEHKHFNNKKKFDDNFIFKGLNQDQTNLYPYQLKVRFLYSLLTLGQFRPHGR